VAAFIGGAGVIAETSEKLQLIRFHTLQERKRL
jgi:hypothetical protein